VRHVVVDVESLKGTYADGALVQVGAVAFDEDGLVAGSAYAGSVAFLSEFEAVVSLEDNFAHGLGADAPTLRWWMQQDRSLVSRLFRPPSASLTLAQAFQGLRVWYDALPSSPAEPFVWGCKNYDFPVLLNAARACGEVLPWNRRQHRDLKTFREAVWVDGEPEEFRTRSADEHDALADARHEARRLLHALAASRSRQGFASPTDRIPSG
jgi:hypothetical protein